MIDDDDEMGDEPVDAAEDEPLAAFMLALLEQQGIISSEMASVVRELTEQVIPINHESACSVVGDAVSVLPPWDGCPQCRMLILQYKAGLQAFHDGGHPNE